MKIRQGFVSNSSSSSFIIIADKKPTIEQVLKAFGKVNKSIFKDLAKDCARTLIANIESRANNLAEYCNQTGWEPEDINKNIKNAFDSGKSIFHGSVSDEDNHKEYVLCSLGINYKDADIEIIKEAWY